MKKSDERASLVAQIKEEVLKELQKKYGQCSVPKGKFSSYIEDRVRALGYSPFDTYKIHTAINVFLRFRFCVTNILHIPEDQYANAILFVDSCVNLVGKRGVPENNSKSREAPGT